MSKARHRGPVHRGLRTHLVVLWTTLWTTAVVRRRVTRRTARRVYNAPPAEICRVGLTMADAIAAATTNYPVVEPCPWGAVRGGVCRHGTRPTMSVDTHHSPIQLQRFS